MADRVPVKKPVERTGRRVIKVQAGEAVFGYATPAQASGKSPVAQFAAALNDLNSVAGKILDQKWSGEAQEGLSKGEALASQHSLSMRDDVVKAFQKLEKEGKVPNGALPYVKQGFLVQHGKLFAKSSKFQDVLDQDFEAMLEQHSMMDSSLEEFSEAARGKLYADMQDTAASLGDSFYLRDVGFLQEAPLIADKTLVSWRNKYQQLVSDKNFEQVHHLLDAAFTSGDYNGGIEAFDGDDGNDKYKWYREVSPSGTLPAGMNKKDFVFQVFENHLYKNIIKKGEAKDYETAVATLENFRQLRFPKSGSRVDDDPVAGKRYNILASELDVKWAASVGRADTITKNRLIATQNYLENDLFLFFTQFQTDRERWKGKKGENVDRFSVDRGNLLNLNKEPDDYMVPMELNKEKWGYLDPINRPLEFVTAYIEWRQAGGAKHKGKPVLWESSDKNPGNTFAPSQEIFDTINPAMWRQAMITQLSGIQTQIGKTKTAYDNHRERTKGDRDKTVENVKSKIYETLNKIVKVASKDTKDKAGNVVKWQQNLVWGGMSEDEIKRVRGGWTKPMFDNLFNDYFERLQVSAVGDNTVLNRAELYSDMFKMMKESDIGENFVPLPGFNDKKWIEWLDSGDVLEDLYMADTMLERLKMTQEAGFSISNTEIKYFLKATETKGKAIQDMMTFRAGSFGTKMTKQLFNIVTQRPGSAKMNDVILASKSVMRLGDHVGGLALKRGQMIMEDQVEAYLRNHYSPVVLDLLVKYNYNIPRIQKTLDKFISSNIDGPVYYDDKYLKEYDPDGDENPEVLTRDANDPRTFLAKESLMFKFLEDVPTYKGVKHDTWGSWLEAFIASTALNKDSK